MPSRYQPLSEFQTADALLPLREIEEVGWQRLSVRAPCTLVTQAVEAMMGACIQRPDPRLGIILEKCSEQFGALMIHTLSEDGAPTARSNVREGEIEVLWIHCKNLLVRWCAEHLDNFHKLVHTILPRKKWPAPNHFSKNTAHGPEVNRRGVICRAKDELGCTVVA